MRLLQLARLAYGSTLLVAPHVLLRQGVDGRVRAVARILGARQLLQAVLVPPDSSPRRVCLGALVDGSHAATMAACAVISPKHRRLAGRNALTALGFAAAGLAEVRRRTP
jgi:hypothetical protein